MISTHRLRNLWQKLKDTQGNVSVNNGIVTFEDGSAFDIRDEKATQVLKPCPAGHKADEIHLNDDGDSWVASCDDPSCCWVYAGNNLSKKEAIKGWNHRVNLTPPE